MALFTIKQLTTPITLAEAEEQALSIVQDQGITTTDWKDGSPELTCIKLWAEFYSEFINRCSQITYNTLNTYAEGPALTYLADSHFDNQRVLAEFTVGNMVVTGSAAIVPKTFQAKELKVTDGDYIFYNQNAFTLSNAIPYVTESFVAELPGAEYNISPNSSLTSIASNVGISIFNPPVTGSTTWITTLGRDEESDDTLRKRNTSKWTTLQTSEVTLDRLINLSLSASPQLEYISVDDSQSRGPGTVDVYCARKNNPTTASDITLVQNALNLAFFGNSTGSRVTAYAASNKYFDRTLTIYYGPTVNGTTLYTTIKTTIDTWIATIPIGGNIYTATLKNIASLNDLIRDLESLEGVVKVKFNDTTDITLDINEKLVSPTTYDTLITLTELAYNI